MNRRTITSSLSAALLVLAGCLSAAEESAGNVAALPDIGGNWRISSRVGADGPAITVHCTLIQDGSRLSGSCTPEMENPEASELSGNLAAGTASWGYDVVFNGNPGRVDFVATALAADAMSGTLSLSGTEAPFTAAKE